MKETPPYPQEPSNLLKGKNVLLTAAAGSGIGFALAKRCVEEGGNVFISDIHERRTAEAAEKLSEIAGEEVGHAICNVTDQEHVDGLIEKATDHFGSIDVLMNNAGLGGTANVHEMTDDQWNKVIDVSLTGTFRMVRATLQHMYEHGGGAIVNNASVIGWRAQKGQAHYAAAKAGVMAFTRCSALEAADHNVRVNAVAPSLAMHPFLHKVTSEELLEKLTDQEAFGRYAEPWEVANVMIFLASHLSSYMTGEVLSVSSQRA
jgi:3-oxoacyl-[acyl-carrier protein] reductase